MIAKTNVYSCRACGSQNIVKNGHNACDSQRFWCKDCGKRGVLEPKHSYTPEQKEQILSAYTNERSSMRGIQRTFAVSRNTLTSWLKKDQQNPKLEDTLLPAQAEDVLEVDERWSFVQQHRQERWLWTAMCRRTRQIIAYAIGDRSQKTCQLLWERIPTSYKACQSFSDLWDSLPTCLPSRYHA